MRTKFACTISPIVSFMPKENLVEVRFNELAAQWKERTRYVSILTPLFEEPLYQSVIALGPEAIPYLIADMKTHHTHWMHALSAIVGRDVGANCRTVPEAVEAWSAWYTMLYVVNT